LSADVNAPIVQYVARPQILDLGWGHPTPATLPTDAWAQAVQVTLSTYGWQAMTYGRSVGPGPLIDWLAEHIGTVDSQPCRTSEIFVTAGASHALALVGQLLVQPGDVVLVDAPTYHLAFRIMRDAGAELVSVPTDDQGVDPGAAEALICHLRRTGRRVSMLYLVPTFGNPTGRSLPAERRSSLVEVCARADVTIVEDDPYREIGFDGPAPGSLWCHSERSGIVRLGSFSKTVAPGLRLGWINASAGLITKLATLGYVDSGGGVNHTSALTMATFGASGAYGRHTDMIRRQYRLQRDSLVAALRTTVPDVPIAVPAGGWFIWMELPGGLTAAELLPVAEQTGVSFVEGPRFFCDRAGGSHHIRMSYSMLPPADLTEAARRLGVAIESRG
jgi:DNA-binding transcriptional MocR family regulator